MASLSVFQSENLNEIIDVAKRLRRDNEVSRLDFFSRPVSKMLKFPEKYHILVYFAGNRGKVKGENFLTVSKSIDRAQSVLGDEGFYGMEYGKVFVDQLKQFFDFLENQKSYYYGRLDKGVIYPFFHEGERRKIEATINFVKSLKRGFDVKDEKITGEEKSALQVTKKSDETPLQEFLRESDKMEEEEVEEEIIGSEGLEKSYVDLTKEKEVEVDREKEEEKKEEYVDLRKENVEEKMVEGINIELDKSDNNINNLIQDKTSIDERDIVRAEMDEVIKQDDASNLTQDKTFVSERAGSEVGEDNKLLSSDNTESSSDTQNKLAESEFDIDRQEEMKVREDVIGDAVSVKKPGVTLNDFKDSKEERTEEKKESVDYDEIRDIMTNRFGFNTDNDLERKKKEEKKEEK